MRRCQPLMDEILSTDFHPKTKAFSVREVRLITYYLGKPRFVTPNLFIHSTKTTGGSTFAISRSFL